MNLFRFIPKPLKRRMFMYTPAGFDDVDSCGAFYDVRNTVFAGDDMMVLEYSNQGAQQHLFDRATTLLPPQGKVLDIGCGFGHLLTYLDRNGLSYSDYHGVDVSKKMVTTASSVLGDYFEVRDILSDPFEEPLYDTGYVLSVLGYPIGEKPLETMIKFLRNAFSACRNGLVFSHLVAGRKEGLKFTTLPQELAVRCQQELKATTKIDDDGVDFTYLMALYH